MTRFLFVCVALAAVMNPTGLRAATPEQVGTYLGSVKTKKYDYTTQATTRETLGCVFILNADNSYLFSIAGGPVAGTARVNDERALLVNVAGSSVITTQLQFGKNGSVKGDVVIGNSGSPGYLIEGKVKLKKE